MKKTVAAAIITALTFAGIQSVSAHGGRYYSDDNTSGYGCGNYVGESRGITEKDQAALEKFKADTSVIRREIVVTRSELNALMRRDNPDEAKVAKLTGQLYDLETELDRKAEAAEIDNRYAYEHGPGMMRGNGWGRGWHMMGR